MDYPKSVPNVGLVDGKFVDENTATGVVGSLIPSSWGNGVTDEILAVIAAAGIAPDEASHTQLLAAIKGVTLGRLIGVRVFASPGTTSYTPAPGTKSIIVEAQGGGASAGGVSAPSSTQAVASGGGSSGAYGKSYYQISAITYPVAINVGSGGAAPAAGANAGNSGGTTSFGGYLSTPGGSPSSGGTAATPPIVLGGASYSVVPSGANMVGSPGQPGQSGIMVSTSIGFSGMGGASVYGAGGFGRASVNPGAPGAGYGGGGSGALQVAGGTALAGGAGAQGVLIVWEYA